MALAQGAPQRTVELCGCALNRQPPIEVEWQVRTLRAEAYLETGDYPRGLLDCDLALAIRDATKIRVVSARCHVAQDNHVEAVRQYGCACAVGELSAWQWFDFARALLKVKRGVEAQRAAEQAIALAPNELEIFLLLVDTSLVNGQAGKMRQLLYDRLQAEPGNARVWSALGGVEAAAGNHDEAIAAYRQCFAIDPNHSAAAHQLGFLLIRQGEFLEGWKYHEHRLPDAGLVRRAGVPAWRGEPLEGKHLVIWCEQGLGDTIQFARFVPLVALAAKVTFVVPHSLVRIFREHVELGDVRSTEHGLVSADYQTKVMSLPQHLGIGANIAAATCPYLRPNQVLREKWSSELPPGHKVALSWQGNPNYSADGGRSMPFSHYEPLVQAGNGKTTFLSLQKNFGREQLELSSLSRRVLDLGGTIDLGGDAFRDSLAILSLVDLFVTTDTALAHVAGAAGVPTWLLLSAAPDWRWGDNGERTCWYPSMRLCRQRELGDWATLLTQLSVDLPRLLSE